MNRTKTRTVVLLLAGIALLGGCAINDPFQTFYSPAWQNTISPMPAYAGPPLAPATVDPPVEYVQVISLEQAKSVAVQLTRQGYKRIGMSLFETDWPQPHDQAAAQMGRRLGADLVLYSVIGVGTRLEAVPVPVYEPGQSFSSTSSGFVGNSYGSVTTYGSTAGTVHTQIAQREVGRYTHAVHYLTKR